MGRVAGQRHPPKMLVDMRAVWKAGQAKRWEGNPSRASLHTMMVSKPDSFLRQMNVLEEKWREECKEFMRSREEKKEVAVGPKLELESAEVSVRELAERLLRELS